MSQEFELPENEHAFEAEIIKAGSSLQPVIRSAFQTYRNQLAAIREQALSIVVTDENDVEGMAKARQFRLQLVPVRTGTDKKRKELKQESLDMGRAIDGGAKVIINDIEAVEAHLLLQETFKQRAEEARLDERMNARLKELEPYREAYNPIASEIRTMSDEQFKQTLTVAEVMLERKKEQELAEQNARIRAERQAKIEPYVQYSQHPLEYPWEKYDEQHFAAELETAKQAHANAVATLARERAELQRRQEELEAQNQKLAQENAEKERARQEEEARRIQAERIANATRNAAMELQPVVPKQQEALPWELPDGEIPVSVSENKPLKEYIFDLEIIQIKWRDEIEKGNQDLAFVWNSVTDVINNARPFAK